MKSIRPTTATTRKGVIAWLTKYNPFIRPDWLYNHEEFVAVYVNRYTGAIVSYELHTGRIIPASFAHCAANCKKAA